MVVAKVPATHVPVEILCFYIKRKDIGKQVTQLAGDLLGTLPPQIGRCLGTTPRFVQINCFAQAIHGLYPPFGQMPSYISLVKNSELMRKPPHFASYAAVGLAATASSWDLPCFLRAATLSRMVTSMSRNSASWSL